MTKVIWITAFSVSITKLNQRIIHKDDIEFVTEFPCLLGHPVFYKWKGLNLNTTICIIYQITMLMQSPIYKMANSG